MQLEHITFLFGALLASSIWLASVFCVVVIFRFLFLAKQDAKDSPPVPRYVSRFVFGFAFFSFPLIVMSSGIYLEDNKALQILVINCVALSFLWQITTNQKAEQKSAKSAQ